MGWREALKHAFAVERPEDISPTDEQKRIVDAIARAIARKGMTTPAEIMLHVSQPYNYLTANAMHFFRPTASALLWTFKPFLPKNLSVESYHAFAEFLEHRGALDYIQKRIEHFEDEFRRGKRDESSTHRPSPGTDSRPNSSDHESHATPPQNDHLRD